MATQTDTTILIVDDSAENLSVLTELLQPQYRVLAATKSVLKFHYGNSHTTGAFESVGKFYR